MTKSTRLLQLLHILRHRSKRPATAAELAAELGISPRTLYRDIDTLRAQGADIRGEAGIGYQLHSDHSQLPPLMFSQSELEAIIIGIRWAAGHTEPPLAQIRHALREHRRLIIDYTDQHGSPSHRQIQPIALGYFPEVRLLAAWCEKRQDFRHFRCDRIQSIALGSPSSTPHELLLRQWQQRENIRAKDC